MERPVGEATFVAHTGRLYGPVVLATAFTWLPTPNAVMSLEVHLDHRPFGFHIRVRRVPVPVLHDFYNWEFARQ